MGIATSIFINQKTNTAKDVAYNMDEQMKYIIQRIEKDYYVKNPNLLNFKANCMMEEGLTCNCITGIMINYAGYIIKNLFLKDKCKAEYTVEEDIQYIKIIYSGVDIFPVKMTLNNDRKYYFQRLLCNKQDVDNQAYVPFKQYNGLNEIVEEIEKFSKDNIGKLSPQDNYNFEFWIRFLRALRTKSLQESSRAFLAMSIFIFPNKTIKLINDVIVNNKNISLLKNVIDFLSEYLEFLISIGDPKGGFFVKFAKSFEELSNINIAEFIEESMADDLKTLMLDSLQSAYENNIAEVKQHRRGFRLILKSIQKTYKEEGDEYAKKLREKISAFK